MARSGRESEIEHPPLRTEGCGTYIHISGIVWLVGVERCTNFFDTCHGVNIIIVRKGIKASP